MPSAFWLRQVMASAEAASGDLLYSRIPVRFRDRRAVAPAVRVRALPALARPPAADPSARPAHRRRAPLPRLHPPFRLRRRSFRRIGVAAEKLLVAHNGSIRAGCRRIGKAEARTALGLPAGPDDRRSMPAGSTRAKASTNCCSPAERRPEILFLLVGSEGEGPVERRRGAGECPDPALADARDAAGLSLRPPTSSSSRRRARR